MLCAFAELFFIGTTTKNAENDNFCKNLVLFNFLLVENLMSLAIILILWNDLGYD